MAKELSKVGITEGLDIEAHHVSQSVDAFTGIEAYDITLSGSLEVTGSTIIKGNLTVNPTTPGGVNGTIEADTITARFSMYSGFITATQNITSTSGNITATSGNITSGNDVYVGDDLKVTNGAIIGGNVTASGYLIANDITSSNNISASGDIYGTNFIASSNITNIDGIALFQRNSQNQNSVLNVRQIDSGSNGGTIAEFGNNTDTELLVIESDGGLTLASGSIIATTGSITATKGNITATKGNITATTGSITATKGNIIATTGNITAGNDFIGSNNITTVGSITATNGNLNIDTGVINCAGNIHGLNSLYLSNSATSAGTAKVRELVAGPVDVTGTTTVGNIRLYSKDADPSTTICQFSRKGTGPQLGAGRMSLMDTGSSKPGKITAEIQAQGMSFLNDGLSIGSTFNTANVTNTYLLELDQDSSFQPSSTVWTNTSDSRLKENITTASIDICYDGVKNLPLKRFKYKDKFSKEPTPDINQIGWIAQDVKAVLPKAITTGSFTTWSTYTGDDIISGSHIGSDGESSKLFPGERYQDVLAGSEIIEDRQNLDADQIMKMMYGAIQKLQEKVEALELQISGSNS